MVDFGKLNRKRRVELPTDPIALYDKIDRASSTGPLRIGQEIVLKEWYDNRKNESDLIVKMHTGDGKTLVGLLMLYSHMISSGKPCLFVAPNKQLRNQAVKDAKRFGIKHTEIDEDGEIPMSYINGKEILITHVQKVFNGMSKFNKIDIHPDFIVLDDSHACIDSIRDASSVTVRNNGKEADLYKEIIWLFKDNIQAQGIHYTKDLEEKRRCLLLLSYWSVESKNSELLSLLYKYNELSCVRYSLKIIADKLKYCSVYISESKIQIVPDRLPIEFFKPFREARHKIYMSATTQQDILFMKVFAIKRRVIESPLLSNKPKWSGEKMVLFPQLIHESLNSLFIRNTIANIKNFKAGVVIICPSFRLSSDCYEKAGADIKLVNSDNIEEALLGLENGNYHNKLVFSNRYDGINLPDNCCRILVLDGLPYFDNLVDSYEKKVRDKNDLINLKLAQKIEQGLGRGVRGEKDFCVILINEVKLVRFMSTTAFQKYFTSQTQAQIELGFLVAESAKEHSVDISTAKKELVDLMNVALQRDEQWKSFYEEHMNENLGEHSQIDYNTKYSIVEKEMTAEYEFSIGRFRQAALIYQSICDEVRTLPEKGWYQQKMAKSLFFANDLVKSNKVQKSAKKNNVELLLPQDGSLDIQTIRISNDVRLNKLLDWLKTFGNRDELRMHIQTVMNEIYFESDHERFEEGVNNLGQLLGFECQRPDKAFGKGPDNLWAVNENTYYLIECKNGVSNNRRTISKEESGQMHNHCDWFNTNYSKNSNLYRIWVHKTNALDDKADFNHDIFVLLPEKFQALKNDILDFYNEILNSRLDEISISNIHEALSQRHLLRDDFIIRYLVKVTRC